MRLSLAGTLERVEHAWSAYNRTISKHAQSRTGHEKQHMLTPNMDSSLHVVWVTAPTCPHWGLAADYGIWRLG